MTNLLFWLPRRRQSLVQKLTNTAASETIQATAKVTLAAVGLAPVGFVAAGVLKEAFVMLHTQTTHAESAIDPDTAHALLAGLALLKDAADHAGESSAEIASRNDLLARAYDWLNNARTRAANSREDCVFITTIQCLAAACHVGRESLAIQTYMRMRLDLQVLVDAAAQLRREADADLAFVDVFEKWSREVVTPGAQGIILVRRWRRSRAEQLHRLANNSVRRVGLLQDLDALAEKVLKQRNIELDDATALEALVRAWRPIDGLS